RWVGRSNAIRCYSKPACLAFSPLVTCGPAPAGGSPRPSAKARQRFSRSINTCKRCEGGQTHDADLTCLKLIWRVCYAHQMAGAPKRAYRMVARAQAIEQTRRQIIEAATTLFGHRPFDLVSLGGAAPARGR